MPTNVLNPLYEPPQPPDDPLPSLIDRIQPATSATQKTPLVANISDHANLGLDLHLHDVEIVSASDSDADQLSYVRDTHSLPPVRRLTDPNANPTPRGLLANPSWLHDHLPLSLYPMINGLVWNIRGIRGPSSICRLQCLIRLHHLSFVVILELMITPDRVEEFQHTTFF